MDFFRIIGIPILFLILGVIFKLLGRHNNDETSLRDSFAVSTTLMLMILSKSSSDIYARPLSQETLVLFSWILTILIITGASVAWDRYKSWEPNSKKKSLKKGIIWPDLIAFTMFISYQVFTSNLLK
jgi:hypothetical protein